MAPVDICVISRRIFFVQLNVADQCGPSVASLDQVMAEHRILRETAGDRLLESIDIIDPFANKRSFLENVLVHVRYRAGIRVNSQERPALGRVTPTRGCKMP